MWKKKKKREISDHDVADCGARTKEASKSAQGESDTGLRSTTCGTRVHTSIARVCPSTKDSGSSE